MRVLIWFGHPLVFVNASEILVMTDDVDTPSNPPTAPLEQEELEKVPFDVNVSQRPHEEKSFRRVVRTRVDRLAWDRRLSPNPHALTIYLEFVLAREPRQKGLKSVNVKMTMFVFTIELGFPVMDIIVGYEAQSTPFPWNIESNT
jgi:hypothetical protein